MSLHMETTYRVTTFQKPYAKGMLQTLDSFHCRAVELVDGAISLQWHLSPRDVSNKKCRYEMEKTYVLMALCEWNPSIFSITNENLWCFDYYWTEHDNRVAV